MDQLQDTFDQQLKALKAYLAHPGAIYTVLGFVLALLVVYKVAYMMTGHHQGMSIFAAFAAAFGTFSIIGSTIVGKGNTNNPPAKAYNVDAETAYENIKEGLAARYFGNGLKWHFDSGGIEKLSLLYSIKLLVDDPTGRKADKGTMQLSIQIERVGNASGVIHSYTRVVGDPSFELKELCEATTQFIDAVLMMAEQRRAS